MSNSKSSLRAMALARRDALISDDRIIAAQAIAAREFPVNVMHGQVIAGYFPIRNEIDPLPVVQQLRSLGASLALPVVVARDQPLVFRRWAADARLVEGHFGTFEPATPAPVVEPDIVLVPLAAFDRFGHRIGYGAGHYDRTLEQLRLLKKITAIGLAFSVQELDRIPALPHDALLDYIMTERETIDTRSC